MSRSSTLARSGGLCLAGLALAACVSLLPKTKPVQLYRFGPTAVAATGGQALAAPKFNVGLANVDFEHAAAGDRILTVHGDETAYIAGARWVSGAPVLFRDAVVAAFAGDAGPANLLAAGEPARADLTLKLEVRAFEVRYAAAGAPSAHVVLYAALGSVAERTDAERTFTADVPAGDNRVGAIAAAFDQATGQVTTGLVRWVDGRGAAS